LFYFLLSEASKLIKDKIRLVKFQLIVFTLLTALVFGACSSSDKTDIQTDDPAKAFQVAKKNYDKKDYLQSIEDFSYMKIKFSGSPVSDKAQYYLAMSYLKREEFILAAYEFEYLLKNYVTSPLAADARYQLAMCYLGLSPRYNLDQTYTLYAINEFKTFLELYPNDKNAPEADKKILELRDKLAYKELKSGDLYYVMDNYRASIIYYDNVLSEYFETQYADDALCGKIQALVTKKKYEEAKKEIARFELKFPKSNLLNKVLILKRSIPS